MIPTEYQAKFTRLLNKDAKEHYVVGYLMGALTMMLIGLVIWLLNL